MNRPPSSPAALRSVRPCQLAIVGRGKVLDQELAVVKIDEDVDLVAAELLRLLGIPPPPEYSFDADPMLQAAEEPFEGEPSAPWRIRAVASRQGEGRIQAQCGGVGLCSTL